MSSSEQEFGKKIGTYLDQGNADLRAGLAYRLQQARSVALAAAAGATAPAEASVLQGRHALAGGGNGSAGRGERPLYAQPRVWLAIALLAAAMIGYQQWNSWEEQQDLADLDAQILTSDLPIDAYLDRGFQLWLSAPKTDP